MDNKSFRYDIEGLIKDMQIDLNTISALYTEYFLEMKINLQESRNFFANKNWDMLERVIHNIKGVSTSLNIYDIYLISNKLDINLKQGNYSTVDLDINSISELFNAAERDIRDFFKQNDIRI